jgi:predicted transcriptional regulator
MPVTKIKEEAQQLVEELPEDASWDELMHRIYVRQTIEKGLEDSRAGRTMNVKEVRRKFGLPAK